MHFLSLLEAKRDGKALSEAEITSIATGITAGAIPDYQLSAFLMAVYFRGLSEAETAALTLAMRNSGEQICLPKDARPVVDKHSTGGVGDKVSLPLAPLLACLGFRVPMISGRGLGITGGTLDKLDSIAGFKTALPMHDIVRIVQDVGCVICGQTDSMVPADKKLYALRDVTGTVPSIPLIVSSILSKKLAENPDALVLDVKFGRAAFMLNLDEARELAKAMVTLAKTCGVASRALLTRMDAPLGRAAGNWLEVKESVEILQDAGPEDVRTLVVECAAHLLVLTRRETDLARSQATAGDCLTSGAPLQKFLDMLAAQGANLDTFHNSLQKDSMAEHVIEVRTSRPGWVCDCDAKTAGEIVRDLGGGRTVQGAALDYWAGIDRLAKPGEYVETGALLARIHCAEKFAWCADELRDRLRNAFAFADKKTPPPQLVEEVLEAE